MIQTIQDIKDYLKADLKNNHEIYKKNILKEYLIGGFTEFSFLI